MRTYCCKSGAKDEQQIVDSENEYKPIPCTCDNNYNEIYKKKTAVDVWL